MVVSIDFYVPLQVILQNFTVVLRLDGVHEALEHLGDGILSTEEELRGHVGCGLLDSANCVRHELLNVTGNEGILELSVHWPALGDIFDEGLDRLGIGAYFFHRS